jgi:dimethylsulfoniopropionate demethylase
MNMNDTPFECGLDLFVSFNEKINYLGKSTLQEQKEKGVTRSLVGLKLQIDKISLSKTLPIFQNEQLIGDLRSACFSPKFQCCLGIAMIDTTYQNHSAPLNLMIDGQEIIAEMTSIPFTK